MLFPVLPLSPYHYAGDTDEQSKVNQTKEGDAMKLPKQGDWFHELDICCQSLIFPLCCTPDASSLQICYSLGSVLSEMNSTS